MPRVWLRQREAGIDSSQVIVPTIRPALLRPRRLPHYQLGDFAAAETDAEQALRLMSNTNAFTLAGVVKHDVKTMDEAEERLKRAWEMDGANCQAMWNLGLVHTARPDWPAGASTRLRASPASSGARQSARNAAHCLVRTSNPARALNDLAVAAEHPEMKAQAERLRASLPVPR